MRDLLYFISGEVPGGILLLLFLFVVINLALRFLYKSSKLFSKQEYIRKVTKSNIFLISIYIILWFVLRPPGLPQRVLILPFQNDNSLDYAISSSLQNHLYSNLSDNYTNHPWEWYYQTANKDSLIYQSYRLKLAEKLGAGVVISGKIVKKNDGLVLDVIVNNSKNSDQINIQASSYHQASQKLMKWLSQNSDLLSKKSTVTQGGTDEQLAKSTQISLLLLDDAFDQVIDMALEPDSHHVGLLAQAYLDKGITENEDREWPTMDDIQFSNPWFRKLYNLIIPYSKEGKDTAELNISLARMYQQIKNYEMAAICLEKAITQDRYNARNYYYLSFLHKSRYEERGFTTRYEVLLKAVDLDPGYWQAVYEYANALYSSGTAAATNPKTIKAIKSLQDFNKLNPNNEKILALLGKFLLQSKYTREAVQVYEKLVTLSENSAIHHYNLGICYFHLKKYDQAKDLFNKAIEINDYPDAYLYIGAVYRLAGDRDKALYYYRERVKRQSGDDDMYAREAMQGIRIILNEIAEQEEQELKNEPAAVKN